MSSDPLAVLSAPVANWFRQAFERPTRAQELAWPAIAAGENVLVSAPTGSGKTLAAFLCGIDHLVRKLGAASAAQAAKTGDTEERGEGIHIVYVSPLKALSYDVERNLRTPLRGIATQPGGEAAAAIRVGLRTGDTPQRERRAMLRHPPHILITTPESLYLMLTSQARELFATCECVIVDEVHALAPSKRGAHLAITLERLEAAAGRALQRIGLSATASPLEEVGRFLVGTGRSCRVLDAGEKPRLDLEICVPVDDMTEPDSGAELAPTADGAGAQRSIWPAIYPALLELVESHRSTIVFVNNRRGAERLAMRLNELASERAGKPVVVARAHHGSLSREERNNVEELLKAGEIPCIVATSSLELGIDMGAVDLVVQVESPKAVATGLQRVGRAGHGVGEVSKGRVFPKFRADLLEATVVCQRMRDGAIEQIRVPRNPLDVLCQQIVAIAASEEEVSVAKLHALVRRAWPFAELSRELLCEVLDMLDGRYPSEQFAELRPRIVWDRVADTIRPRKGARQLATVNAGTIPDRGLYGVHLPDGRRVGELDEEMVYEARPGQTFLLGATTWRIEEITHDRVIVTPAPGLPGMVPFWRGEGAGRPSELGRAVGEFVRQAADADPAALARRCHLDERAARNLVAYLREQRAATGTLPSDRAVVVERFRDEIGDWRLCVLSPWGGRVHAAWALAISARVRDELGIECDAIWSDDGVVLHLPDAEEPPRGEIALVEPDALEDLVVRELRGSALFGARFRENAARALLLPKTRPGRRTPLWQQRLKAQSLLEVAGRYPRFPIVLETYRECLRDVLDLPALETLLRSIASGEVAFVEVETDRASPFASSLLFDYVATYMYEGDTPNAERRAAALALDRDLLRELLGQEELRELLDADAIAEVEAELQRTHERRRAANADELLDVLRAVGDLTASEIALRCVGVVSPRALLAELERQRRIARVRIAGEERIIAADEAGLYRDAFGCAPPAGLPERFLADEPEARLRVVRRFARTRGPFTSEQANARFGVDVTPELRELERRGELVRGELRPAGNEREWCCPDVLRRLRRASLARLRRELEPVEQATYARFLASWQGASGAPAGGGVGALRDQLIALQALPLAVDSWERDVFPRRLGSYSPTWLDELLASGEMVWVGAGRLGRSGRVAFLFREDARLLGPPPGAGPRPEGPVHDALRAVLAQGARFWFEIGEELSGFAAEELEAALWELVWAGEVTNDSFAPLRAGRRAGSERRAQLRRGTRFARRRRGPAPHLVGRWSLTAPLFRDPPPFGPRMRAFAELLLERYGVVTRETARSESVPGGFAALYGELQKLEVLGVAQRGYFVEGLGGVQFALPSAVERLRSQRDDPEEAPLVIAATDPAQPYGLVLPWPQREDGRRPQRASGALVVLDHGQPTVYVERGGRALLTLGGPAFDDDGAPAPWLVRSLQALAQAASEGRCGRLSLERVDGEPLAGSPLEAVLVELGFRRGPRRLVAGAGT